MFISKNPKIGDRDMKTTKTYRMIMILLAVLALTAASLACSSATPTSAPTVKTATPAAAQPAANNPTSPSESPTPAGPTQVAPTPQPAAYLGDKIELGGYSLTAISVEDPAKKPGMFYQAETGKKLVAIEIVVANVSGDTLSANPLGASLIDSDGFSYALELAGVDNQLATTDLNQGEKVQGWVAFKIPENAKPASLKYETSILGGITLQTSLTPAPEGHAQPTEAAAKASQPPETFLGDAVEFNGYALSGITVQDPAAPGMLYTAKADKKLIAVEVIISNVSGDPLLINPLSLTLVDARGFTYQAELGGVDNQLDTLNLAAGEKVRGWVAFETPKDAEAAGVKYAPDLFGDSAKVGLAKPPDGHTPIPAPAAAAPSASLPKLGDEVDNFGYALTATTLQDPATPGMLFTPKAGYKLVSVEITIGNVSGDQLSVNPMGAYLVDSNGFVYALDLGGVDNQIATMDLNQGEKVKGWAAFVIPQAAQPSSIKYVVDMFSPNQVLQSGLTK
jgi:hypothetical protein